MNSICVFGVFVADLCFFGETIPVKGQTVLGKNHIVGPGGKGSNQAIAISRLGGKVSFICFVGSDALGDEAFNLFKKEKINTKLIKKTKKSTGVGFVILNDSPINSET